MSVDLDQGDKDLLMKVAQFAARKARNGVYLGQIHSASLGAPVLLVVALGDQALALGQILMDAQAPDEGRIVVASGGEDFLDGSVNGNNRNGH